MKLLLIFVMMIEIIISSEGLTCEIHLETDQYHNVFTGLTCSNISSFSTVREYMDANPRVRDQKLSYFRISTSTIPILPEINITNLDKLILSKNHIKNISQKPFQSLKILKELYLDNNELTDLTEDVFSGLNNLEKLFLQHNNISRIDRTVFKNLENLRELYLDNNELTELTEDVFFGLNNLEKLFLHHNSISRIDRSLFRDMDRLLILNISHNSLDKFKIGSFSGLTSLTILDISNNKLLKLNEYNFVSLSKLKKLYLENNPFMERSYLLELINDLPRLKLISFKNNVRLSCRQLKYIFRECNLKSIVIPKGVDFDVDNIGGISCSKYVVNTTYLLPRNTSSY